MTRTSSRFLLGAVLLVPWLAGCVSGGGLPLPSPWLRRAEEPWKVPPEAYPTQRLYRVKYDGPQGKLGFKLTLYLESESSFRMRAADSLGRKVWDLSVDRADHALWLDHRNKEYCSARGASRLAIVPLARLPLVSLPRLLLGRLPATPASELRRSDTSIYFRDERGQLWNGALADGRLEHWSMIEGGEPVTWWQREDEEGVFVDRRGEQTLRWQEVVREPLVHVPPPLEVPSKYRQGSCG